MCWCFIDYYWLTIHKYKNTCLFLVQNWKQFGLWQHEVWEPGINISEWHGGCPFAWNTDPYLPDAWRHRRTRFDMSLHCHENLTSYFVLGLRSANTLLQRSCSARSDTKFLMWLSFSSFLLSKTTTNIMRGSALAITYVLWSWNKWYNVMLIVQLFKKTVC